MNAYCYISEPSVDVSGGSSGCKRLVYVQSLNYPQIATAAAAAASTATPIAAKIENLAAQPTCTAGLHPRAS